MAEALRTTPLTRHHEETGAKLADFAGWRMPIEFEGTLAEHRAVRASVGVFDVSHLGTVWVRGNGALDTVASVFTNDPARLDGHEAQYTLCCRDDGGIVDDLIVYRLAANEFLAVPNAANTAAVVGALTRAGATHGSEVVDASTDYAVLAVQGPRSLELVGRLFGVSADELAFMEVAAVTIEGAAALVCRSGYTGEKGCELVLPGDVAVAVWDRIVDAGAVPAGLGARDTLRLEMGYPLHGNDISTGTNPYEAGLGWAVKLDRGGFRGQEALRALAGSPPTRRLRGLRGEGRRPPRAGMSVLHRGEDVGEVTSGSFSPTLEVGVALAYLSRDVDPGDEVVVDVRGTEVAFTVVEPPFVDRSPRG